MVSAKPRKMTGDWSSANFRTFETSMSRNEGGEGESAPIMGRSIKPQG